MSSTARASEATVLANIAARASFDLAASPDKRLSLSPTAAGSMLPAQTRITHNTISTVSAGIGEVFSSAPYFAVGDGGRRRPDKGGLFGRPRCHRFLETVSKIPDCRPY